MDRVHNVFMKIEGLVLSFLAMAIEVEWVQMLDEVAVFKNWFARALLYGLLTALTFEADTKFVYYEYISFVCACLVCNGIIYFVGAIGITINGFVNKEKFDDSL